MALNNEIIEGRIAKPLVAFTIPVIMAMCLQSLYGAVDLMIAGQFAESADVSAIATISAQGLSVLISFAIIKHQGLPFPFKLSFVRFDKKIVVDTLMMGTPIALQDSLVHLG